MTDAELSVVEDPEAMRYEAYVGTERAGFIQYRREGDAIVMVHTEVDPRFEGRGVGTHLAKAALDDVRAKGDKLVVICPFINRFIGDHPEYADLVAG